jgi:antirestriction protein ArdC
MKLTVERAKDILNRLLAMFESGDLPPAAARTLIQPGQSDRPSDSWSLGNRLLMLLHGTEDARGFKQWQQVGRRVKRGARAFHILAPSTRVKTVTVEDPETGEEREEKRHIVTGFRLVPVFRYEDTEGEALPEYRQYSPPAPPPLQDVAKAFGVEEIIYAPASGSCYGFYTWKGKKKIVLHTHDVKTWFHELGHAVHHTFRPLKGGQVPEQEIVAEIFAAVMCELHGVTDYRRNVWDYVKCYASQDPREALKAIFRVLADVEECLRRVLTAASVTDSEGGAAA